MHSIFVKNFIMHNTDFHVHVCTIHKQEWNQTLDLSKTFEKREPNKLVQVYDMSDIEIK